MTDCYLFLDVDGVLNTERDWQHPFSLNAQCLKAFGSFLDALASNRDINCVLTTSWRTGLCAKWADCSPQVRELWDFLVSHGVQKIGKTPMIDARNRTREVLAYIHAHGITYTDCIVIDDDMSLFSAPLPKGIRFIFCDAKQGFVNPSDTGNGGVLHGFFEIKRRIHSLF